MTSTLVLLLTSVIWGFSFVAQVEGSRAMGALTYNTGRFMIGAVALLPVILLFERKRGRPGELRDTLRYGAITGSVLFIAITLQQYGIELTQAAGKAAFITGLYTVLTPLFAVFLGKKPGLLTGLGAVSAFAGLYFLSVPDGLGSVALGDILLIACAVCWAVHIMLIDAYAPRVRPFRLSFVQFGACAALSAVSMLFFEQPEIAQLQAGLMPLLYGGLMSSAVAYTLQIICQRDVEPSKAAIIYSLEALFAAIGGFLLLGELMGWKGYLGAALMFVGILLSQMKTRQSPSAAI